MKLTHLQLPASFAVLLASFTIAQARPDTLPTYDENDLNTATVGTHRTNHPLGYVGFYADIDTAWNNREGGVIDEFSPNGNTSSFNGSPFTTGYGEGGSYDPNTGTVTGRAITFDVPDRSWDLATNGSNAAPAISLDYFMLLSGASLGQSITMATTTRVNVTELGFTVLANDPELVTALAFFSDGTSYSEDFDTGVTGNTFFGAVAPVGQYIKYFAINSASGNKIFIDDLAFSTAVPVPEASTLGFAVLGLALAGRRRRAA